MAEQSLPLTKIDIAGMWSVQPSRNQTLGDFTAVLCAESDHNASLTIGDGLYLLRAWPHQAYLLTDEPALPAAAEPFEALMTDIADAYCAFCLTDEAAFDFIADYLSTDIRRIDANHHCLRCRLGHYTVLLWWQDRNKLQLLVERSLAQSFEDYFDHLMKGRPGHSSEFNRQPARLNT